jgi:hypothetical protein
MVSDSQIVLKSNTHGRADDVDIAARLTTEEATVSPRVVRIIFK